MAGRRGGLNQFTLHVIPAPDGHYGVEVRQHLNGAEGTREVPVARAWGPQFAAVAGIILEALRKSGYRASDLHGRRREPFALREEWGVRVALALLALKRVRKSTRMERIVQGIAAMPDEECYYWFSKCAKTGQHRFGQRALRVLVTGG